MHSASGGKVIGVGVNIYIYNYVHNMFVDQKYWNHTLAIDSLFQIFVVELLIEFID